jgi:hypothetical protein
MKSMLLVLCALAVLTVGALTNPQSAAARRAPCSLPITYGHTTGGDAPTEFCPDTYPILDGPHSYSQGLDVCRSRATTSTRATSPEAAEHWQSPELK